MTTNDEKNSIKLPEVVQTLLSRYGMHDGTDPSRRGPSWRQWASECQDILEGTRPGSLYEHHAIAVLVSELTRVQEELRLTQDALLESMRADAERVFGLDENIDSVEDHLASRTTPGKILKLVPTSSLYIHDDLRDEGDSPTGWPFYIKTSEHDPYFGIRDDGTVFFRGQPWDRLPETTRWPQDVPDGAAVSPWVVTLLDFTEHDEPQPIEPTQEEFAAFRQAVDSDYALDTFDLALGFFAGRGVSIEGPAQELAATARDDAEVVVTE